MTKQITFKATKKIHSSGYAIIEKKGNLEHDFDKHSFDGIWLHPKKGERIFIDCNPKTKEFTIHFNSKEFQKFKD